MNVDVHLKFQSSSSSGSLNDRHIQNGSELYAIFTPNENVKQAPQMPKQDLEENSEGFTIRCHIMLKVNSESQYWPNMTLPINHN